MILPGKRKYRHPNGMVFESRPNQKEMYQVRFFCESKDIYKNFKKVCELNQLVIQDVFNEFLKGFNADHHYRRHDTIT